MDHAVSLVQAYLQLNGYFTAAEYPIMEPVGKSGFRTLTDIDILAFRFPTTSNGMTTWSGPGQRAEAGADPGLDVPADRIDMLIGEVKEGRVGINSGAIEPGVLRTVMLRFGCAPDDVETLLEGLKREGSVVMSSGYQIRLVAFGAMPPGDQVPPCRIISLGHVLRYLQDYVRRNWKMLRHCQFKDPAFGFLITLEKARRGGAGRRGSEGVEMVSAERVERRTRARAPKPAGSPPRSNSPRQQPRPIANQRPLSDSKGKGKPPSR